MRHERLFKNRKKIVKQNSATLRAGKSNKFSTSHIQLKKGEM